MEATFKFSIQNLLMKWNGKMTGPITAILFAEEVASNIDIEYHYLALIEFEDKQINQIRESDRLTGHDTLIIGCRYTNDLWLSIWVDEGYVGRPIAMRYQSNKEPTVMELYEDADYVKKLDRMQIQQIFDYVFDNPQLLAIEYD
jgi:hypothetical protein